MRKSCMRELQCWVTTMKAIINRVIYQGDNGWTVMDITVDGCQFKATGHLTSDIHAGSSVELTGEWVIHPKYGKQFKIATALTVAPSTTLGIEKWLASGSVGNIGHAMA